MSLFVTDLNEKQEIGPGSAGRMLVIMLSLVWSCKLGGFLALCLALLLFVLCGLRHRGY
jgi:hypothetical protein